MSDDVANIFLERGARRALVCLFGEGWCNSDFANLSQKIRDSVVKGIGKRTTPTNVFPLLFAAQHATKKLGPAIDAWADITREMVQTAQKGIDECLVKESEVCFERPEWVEMLEGDGAGFEDGEWVGWVMDALKRGMSEHYAPTVYQARRISLDSQILIDIGFLPDTRVQRIALPSRYGIRCNDALADISDPCTSRRRPGGSSAVD